MDRIKCLSHRIHQKLEPNLCIDPMTIILITSIVIEVIKLLNECNQDDEKAVITIKNVSYRNEYQFNRILRKKLGFFRYWLQRKKYTKSFREIGETISVKEMCGLRQDMESNTKYNKF